jgi:kynurenine 3-monooxygenase
LFSFPLLSSEGQISHLFTCLLHLANNNKVQKQKHINFGFIFAKILVSNIIFLYGIVDFEIKFKIKFMENPISIIGNGLVGSLLSIFLAKKGFKVNIFDKRSDPRFSNHTSGRSINLALSTRGLTALKKIGLDQKVIANAIPFYGRMVHQLDGKVIFQPYTHDKKPLFAISRSILNQILIEETANYSNLSSYFNHQLEKIEVDKNQIIFKNTKENTNITYKSNLIFGADGFFSVVKECIKKNNPNFIETIDYLDFSYLELTLPSKNKEWIIEKHALHIWPRKNFMFMALPNLDGSFTCTLYLPNTGSYSFEKLDTTFNIESFFKEFFPDILLLIPNLVQEFQAKKPSFLATIRCFPWTHDQKIALIGDAAHAIVPFYGQGMNCGFEDCTILDDMISDSLNIEDILQNFEASRKPNADAIATMALENFIEMRDLVTDNKFLAMKKIESELKIERGEKWQTKYEMVTFSNMPYEEVLKKNILQNQILEDIYNQKFSNIL